MSTYIYKILHEPSGLYYGNRSGRYKEEITNLSKLGKSYTTLKTAKNILGTLNGSCYINKAQTKRHELSVINNRYCYNQANPNHLKVVKFELVRQDGKQNELPFILPEKWYMRLTEEIITSVNIWRSKPSHKSNLTRREIPGYIHSDISVCISVFDHGEWTVDKKPGYTEISNIEFLEHVYIPYVKSKTKRLTLTLNGPKSLQRAFIEETKLTCSGILEDNRTLLVTVVKHGDSITTEARQVDLIESTEVDYNLPCSWITALYRLSELQSIIS